MPDIITVKKALRQDYIQKRKAIPAEKKAAAEKKMIALFRSLISYRYSDVLMLYYPLNSEIDPLPLAEAALKEGKTVAFPRCGEDHRMDFRIVTSLCEDFESGMYGLHEPKETCPILDPEKDGRSKICVIPAVVYDREGYRLGYGKGYYDRYLSGFAGMKVGFAYEELILDRIPRGRYDLAVDLLISEKGVHNLHAH